MTLNPTSIEQIDQRKTVVFGWQKKVSYTSLWNIIIAMREGVEIPPVHLRTIKNSDALIVDPKRNDPRATNNRKDGGHTRIAAAEIERVPLTAEVGGRALLWLPGDALEVKHVELVQEMGNEDQKKADNPHYYQHTPNKSEIEFMRNGLRSLINS